MGKNKEALDSIMVSLKSNLANDKYLLQKALILNSLGKKSEAEKILKTLILQGFDLKDLDKTYDGLKSLLQELSKCKHLKIFIILISRG
jgi:hypothetical protein